MDDRCDTKGNCTQPGCDCTEVRVDPQNPLQCLCQHSPDMHATSLKAGLTKPEGYTDDFCGYNKKDEKEIAEFKPQE